MRAQQRKHAVEILRLGGVSCHQQYHQGRERAPTPHMLPNDELERPSADSDRALCAHNNLGAHSAPPHLSLPLQAMV